MSETLRHAVEELDRLGTPADDTGRVAVERLLALLVQQKDTDSETARQWVVDIFSRLANFEVLTPLTGERHEWREIPETQQFGNYNYQNKRASSVFAMVDVDENDFRIIDAIDSQALTFVYKGEDDPRQVGEAVVDRTFQSWGVVVFPYTPVRYVIEVQDDEGRTIEEMAMQVRDHLAHGGTL